MTHRTPTSHYDDQPDETSFEADQRRTAELQRQDQPTIDPAAEAPNSAASEVDPNPAAPAGPGAATPDAARASEPALTGGSGGAAGSGRPKRDGKGRFLAKPAIPPMSAGLAQALLDADAETWRVDNAIRTARVLVYAIEFDDLVRHAAGDGGS